MRALIPVRRLTRFIGSVPTALLILAAACGVPTLRAAATPAPSPVTDPANPAAPSAAPGTCGADLAPGDLDARLLPWDTLRRLALEAGLQPPVDEPLGARELADLLAAIAAAAGPAQDDPGEAAALAGLEALTRAPPVRGRLLAGYADRGLIQTGEAGWAWAPGWNGAVEVGSQAARGPWWAALSLRGHARTGWGAGPAPDAEAAREPLAWPGWDPATGPAQQRRALLLADGAGLDLVRSVVGVELGNWSLGFGWDPRRHGPGLGGALLLDRDGPSFAALTARRTRPLRWRGWLRPLAPETLLLRAGRLSERQVADASSPVGLRPDEPWFFQWLLRWRATSWCRFGLTHAAMAVPRDGTLWPDLLQISFPTAGTTWEEAADGPLTDRLFAAQLELRWRRGPWPWLPSAAGRAWWEYAGTDFLPRGPGGIFPEIAAPASIAGIELLGPRWDLACEYAETLHPLVLWYANGSFPSGYSHEGWLLGAGLGGGGERWSGLVRWRRPSGTGAAGGWQAELGFGRTSWGTEGHSPSLARERRLSLAFGPLRQGLPGPWRARAEWRRSESLGPAGGASRRWWALALERRI